MHDVLDAFRTGCRPAPRRSIEADQVNAGKYFEKAIGHRGFDVNDPFIVTADNQGDPQTRVITFEDSHGRVATGVASSFLVISA